MIPSNSNLVGAGAQCIAGAKLSVLIIEPHDYELLKGKECSIEISNNNT
jgi:hypothetical protein